MVKILKKTDKVRTSSFEEFFADQVGKKTTWFLLFTSSFSLYENHGFQMLSRFGFQRQYPNYLRH